MFKTHEDTARVTVCFVWLVWKTWGRKIQLYDMYSLPRHPLCIPPSMRCIGSKESDKRSMIVEVVDEVGAGLIEKTRVQLEESSSTDAADGTAEKVEFARGE